MKISTRGRYGLVAMIDLAMRCSEGLVSLKSIAERQGISENYLEQLFAALKKAGLIAGTRGAQGGYELAREPADISAGDVLRALEGSLAPVDCVGEAEEKGLPCKRSEICTTRAIWLKIKDGIYEVVDALSLEELARQYIGQEMNINGTYYI